MNKQDEDKAREVAVKWKAKGLPYNAIYDSCLEMAQWKDEQYQQKLKMILNAPNEVIRIELLTKLINNKL